MKSPKIKDLNDPVIVKLFTGTILKRKMDFLYLTRDDPTSIWCTTISPDMLFHHAKLESDSVHHITSKVGPIVHLWDEQYPLLKNYDHVCVCMAGMAWLKRKGFDINTTDNYLRQDDFIYALDEVVDEEDGTVTEEVVPLLWLLSRDHIVALQDIVRDLELFMQSAEHTEIVHLPAALHIQRYHMIRPSVAFGKRLHIPYQPGIAGPDVKAYCTRAGCAAIHVKIGKIKNTVRIITYSDSEVADTVSVMPACYWYILK